MPGLAYLAANFVFDYALLWATGRLQGLATAPSRLALGAWLGAAFFALLPPAPSPLVLALSCVGLSWLMSAAAFRARPLRALGSVVATLWAVGFVAGGAGLAAQNLLSGVGRHQIGPAVSLVALMAVAVAARRQLAALTWARALRVGVRLRFHRRTLVLEGLVDTGNYLVEPVEKLPVILVDPRALVPLLQPPLRELVEELAQDPFALAARLPALAPEWARRFRLVPFRAVGTERGVMAGFRADSLMVQPAGGRPVVTGPAVVALSPTPLDHGSAQALVPAECVAPSGPPRQDMPLPAAGRLQEGGVVGVEAG